MARPGISYIEVVDAATQLISQNQSPTIERIRAILGTGSSTTIANHFKRWKEAQEPTDRLAIKENLPQELVSTVKGLWERIASQTEIEIAALEENHQTVISELREELQKYKANNQRWQHLYNQWLEEKDIARENQLTLEQALEFAQKENASLHVKQDALLQQAQEKQTRIDELNRYHQQAQANLEHYREAARQQRVTDQEQFELQKQALQSELKILKEQNSSLQQKFLFTQGQYQSLEKENHHLEQSHAQTLSQLEKRNIEIVSLEKLKNENLQMSQHWQSQSKELQQILDKKSTQLIEVQAKTRVLLEQLSSVQQSLKEATDQNKLLTNEKWELAEEKAQLNGQLKQMQKMISA